MQPAKPTQVFVSTRDDRAVFVKPVGACTMSICRTIQSYLEQRRSAAQDVYFDMSEVRLIDSTFTGMLLSLALKKKDPSGPDIHLLTPSDRTMQALTSMHVHMLFDIRDAVDSLPHDWAELNIEPYNPRQATDLVIECHEELISADERNESEFRPVVDAFRREGESSS